MCIRLAFRAFFQSLFNARAAEKISQALQGEGPTPGLPAPPAMATREKIPPPPARSEAITLLATLQREARLVDFFKESLAGFSDAQVGAVARNIHRDGAAVLERLFAIRPALPTAEGQSVEVPAQFDAGRYKLVGRVGGEGPFRGQLLHAGWEATHCTLPQWQGSGEAQRVIAPAEVELK